MKGEEERRAIINELENFEVRITQNRQRSDFKNGLPKKRL
jgi:hypothetical protein